MRPEVRPEIDDLIKPKLRKITIWCKFSVASDISEPLRYFFAILLLLGDRVMVFRHTLNSFGVPATFFKGNVSFRVSTRLLTNEISKIVSSNTSVHIKFGELEPLARASSLEGQCGILNWLTPQLQLAYFRSSIPILHSDIRVISLPD